MLFRRDFFAAGFFLMAAAGFSFFFWAAGAFFGFFFFFWGVALGLSFALGLAGVAAFFFGALGGGLRNAARGVAGRPLVPVRTFTLTSTVLGRWPARGPAAPRPRPYAGGGGGLFGASVWLRFVPVLRRLASRACGAAAEGQPGPLRPLLAGGATPGRRHHLLLQLLLEHLLLLLLLTWRAERRWPVAPRRRVCRRCSSVNWRGQRAGGGWWVVCVRPLPCPQVLGHPPWRPGSRASRAPWRSEPGRGEPCPARAPAPGDFWHLREEEAKGDSDRQTVQCRAGGAVAGFNGSNSRTPAPRSFGLGLGPRPTGGGYL